MTEPVAWMWKTERGTILGFTQNDDIHSGGKLGIPLYTAEDLHPRVKMTEDEKNVLVDFKKHWTFTQFVSAIEGNYENNMYFEKVYKTFRKMRIDNGYMIDEDKLMQAWLYPKTIKVVDE